MKKSANFSKMHARNFLFTSENEGFDEDVALSLIQIVESDRFYAALAGRIFSLTFIHQVPTKEEAHFLGQEVIRMIKADGISCGFIVNDDGMGTYKLMFKSTAKGNN